jgi:hypothetical protein
MPGHFERPGLYLSSVFHTWLTTALQPRRFRIVPSADGCKRLLGGFRNYNSLLMNTLNGELSYSPNAPILEKPALE